MQLLRAFTHFVFIRSKQTAIFSVTERQNHPYSFSKVFQRIKSLSRLCDLHSICQQQKVSTPMWLDLMIMKEFLTTNIIRSLLCRYNLIRVFLSKIQCLLLATLAYYRGTLCIVYLYQFSLLLDVNYNLLPNITLNLTIGAHFDH